MNDGMLDEQINRQADGRTDVQLTEDTEGCTREINEVST